MLARLAILVALAAGAVPVSEADRAAVAALASGFDPASSLVAARLVEAPTRALLDWQARHDNPVLYQTANQTLTAPTPAPEPITLTFDGLFVPGTVVDDMADTPLAEVQPMAPGLLADYLAKWNFTAAEPFLVMLATVSQQTWGNPYGGVPLQQISAVYLRRDEMVLQLWVEVEFDPAVTFVKGVTDGDGDGFAEMFAQVAGHQLPIELLQRIRDDYLHRWLSDDEVKTYFFELASAWYPTANTTLVEEPAMRPWPNEATEEPIRALLGETAFEAPTAVMRAEPEEGRILYLVFCVDADPAKAPTEAPAEPTIPAVGEGGEVPTPGAAPGRGRRGDGEGRPPRRRPEQPPGEFVLIASPATAHESNLARWRAELAANGGTWAAWAERLTDYRAFVRAQLDSRPERIKALFGLDGQLFFRGSLEYLIAGDLREQADERDPFPAIVDYQQQLAARGIDLLLVVIPSKPEVYPRAAGPLPVGMSIAQPYTRKLLLELGEAGVEAVDLLPEFVAAAAGETPEDEPFYMFQDTHWSNRAARLAARLMAERVKQYDWFANLPAPRAYTTREAAFSRMGDLRGMLPDAEKLQFPPMELVAEQVVNPNGSLYEDDPTSPIVMLGDSFCGTFHHEDCGHAGVSAHLARELGVPIDLVMAHGSGPKIRANLAQRGPGALDGKRLVIWTVVARDLWHYWAPWAKVPLP